MKVDSYLSQREREREREGLAMIFVTILRINKILCASIESCGLSNRNNVDEIDLVYTKYRLI